MSRLLHILFTEILLYLSMGNALAQSYTLQWNDSICTIGAQRDFIIDFDIEGPCSAKPCYDYRNNGPTLDTLVTFLKQHPNIRASLGVHLDIRTWGGYSMHLSEKRAMFLCQLLTDMGIDSTRLVPKGHGNTLPIISKELIEELPTVEARERAHARNRRITITIIDR